MPTSAQSRVTSLIRSLAIALTSLAAAITPFAAHAADSIENHDEVSRLALACAKNLPVLVIDNFPPGNDFKAVDFSPGAEGTIIDLDGDGVTDLFHGELVAALYQLEGRETRRLALPRSGSLPDLADLMAQVLKDLENGRVRYALINLSQVTPLKLKSFKTEIFASNPSVPEINAQNLLEFTPKILETLQAQHPEFRIDDLRLAFSHLQSLGIPVVVAAGNSGPGYVNLFSLMPGVISVGSLSPRNEPLRTSAMNPYVKHWRPGVVVPKGVVGGVDLNSDSLPDIPASRLSGKPSLAGAYHGRTVDEALRQIPEDLWKWDEDAIAKSGSILSPNAGINILPVGLYKVEDLGRLRTTNKPTAELFASLGEFALKTSMGQPLQYFFERTPEGRLSYNPAGDGSERQLTRIPGTSFAAPRICRL